MKPFCAKSTIKTIKSLEMIKFDHNTNDKVLTCFFTGKLDTIKSTEVADEVYGKINALKTDNDTDALPGDKVVFDMSGVDYIASSFIRICVNASKLVQKGNFSLVNCDPFLKKTFKIAGLDSILNVK